MTLQETIKGSLKEAMMAKDTVKLTVIRGLMSAFTNELVTLGRTPQDALTDDEALTVIRRAVKQRKDAIEQFTNAGRPELAESEQAELALLEVYLPQMMSKDEIKAVAVAKKAELGIEDKSKSGMLMSALMKDLKGKADGTDVKEVVESLF
ncbi:MAG TPA: GatB/YqeY domain-containing protein [Candidatus Paceibacterota bacterium]